MLVLGYNVPSLCSKGGAVSLDVKAYKFGGNSPLVSFDSLLKGNKPIEQLEGTAARTTLQSEVEGYDFIVYIEVKSENVYSLIELV